MKPTYYDFISSPLGRLLIAVNDGEIVWCGYADQPNALYQLQAHMLRFMPNAECVESRVETESLRQLLDAYFNARLSAEMVFAFHGTPFQKKVWQALLEIPYGGTCTYKDIASACGNPAASRAVGGAVNKNPIAILVPCHRVIGAAGKLVGYNGGLDKKRFLLELEKNEMRTIPFTIS